MMNPRVLACNLATSSWVLLGLMAELLVLPFFFSFLPLLPVVEMFGDVKYVLMGGSNDRMGAIAKDVQSALHLHYPVGTSLVPIGKQGTGSPSRPLFPLLLFFFFLLL